jgi:CheY-like chemotaxis protein
MMLQTLVENAIKHGLEPKPEGGRLEIGAEIVDGQLAVHVEDNGMGFMPKPRGGVGSPTSGSGSRACTTAGRAHHRRAARGGTRATIKVPYEICATLIRRISRMQPPRPPTAVVVDDERLMREQMVSRLKEAWPELEIVGEGANGREAIALVQSLEPDIAFLDISMPGMDGIEAARALAGKVHVVFVTAHDQHAIRAFEYGAVDYLLKPADPSAWR